MAIKDFSPCINHMDQLATKVLPCEAWWIHHKFVSYILSVYEQIISLRQLPMQLFKKNAVTKKILYSSSFMNLTAVLAFLIILDLSVYIEPFLMVLPSSLSLCFLWLLVKVSPLLFLPVQLGFPAHSFFPSEMLSYGLSWFSSLPRQKPSSS